MWLTLKQVNPLTYKVTSDLIQGIASTTLELSNKASLLVQPIICRFSDQSVWLIMINQEGGMIEAELLSKGTKPGLMYVEEYHSIDISGLPKSIHALHRFQTLFDYHFDIDNY